MARRRLDTELTSFEAMWPSFFKFGTTVARGRSPFERPFGMYVVVEAMSGNGDPTKAQQLVEEAFELGLLKDAVIANSLREAEDLCAIREATEIMTREYGEMAAFDASIPTSRIAPFLEAFEEELRSRWPAVEYATFGHIGDANLHIGVRIDQFSGTEEEIENVIYPLIGRWEGGVSGEHGIGVHKVPYLKHARSDAQIDVMRALKLVLDPRSTLNPGKVFSRARSETGHGHNQRKAENSLEEALISRLSLPKTRWSDVSLIRI
ncbi:FAD/FMN-containing dehydrogenase [Sphingobium sp. B1D7B]|uniref:FAD-linked oxidase C-terminal domain-containing protein n=1 Tax=Sphingobium sp. B1D7B TaxID=2940578 RepID=UPI002225290C|nr:FAD-linked oxidase C-terminal domain-containing protein [Sphingobium sp. B1D7B]MCW2406907.1 FAD/FMN-containing dehydrogenase [Sphingobium sp. B1D7B]